MKFKHTFVSASLLLMLSFTAFGQDAACPLVIDSPHTKLYEPLYHKVLCEYDANGNCIGSIANTPKLNEYITYFDTRFRSNGVELIWQTKKAKKGQVFTLYRSKDGQQFHELGTVDIADYEGTQYSFLDNLPFLGNNYYLLKTKNKKGESLVSSQQSVYANVGLVYMETVAIQKSNNQIQMNYFIDNDGLFQYLVTDLNGAEHDRKNVALKKGKNKLTIQLPYNGIYFVTLTNGFSSITDIVSQSEGTTVEKTAVVMDKIILH